MDIRLGLTFDDVLLVPQYSDILSRRNVDLKTRVSKNINLNIPIISSNMDTVTEERMAIKMARNGGLGFIHRYCSVEEEVNMVKQVKRAETYIIYDPYTVTANQTIGELKERIYVDKVNSYLVVNDCEKNKLEGIITNRDIKFRQDYEKIENCMIPIDKMILCNEGTSMEKAQEIMYTNRVQKLPIITNNNEIVGLICLKDIERIKSRPFANLDNNGQLRCGASIGVKEDSIERAKKLIDAGVDVIVIDIAHGDSAYCINTTEKFKEQFPNIDVVSGNVATADGAERLIKAGADGVKVSIGSGSICTTRIVSGSGVPQFTALMDCAPVCKKYNVPLISDGGNRNSGNMCKALAIGADCVMLGRMIAGTDESPGRILVRDGKRVKIIRGMAGYGANMSNSQRQGINEPDSLSFTPEGVEGYVPYAGPVDDVLKQLCDGIRSGISYSGANNIPELQSKAKFIRMTNNGVRESGVHDIIQI